MQAKCSNLVCGVNRAIIRWNKGQYFFKFFLGKRDPTGLEKWDHVRSLASTQNEQTISINIILMVIRGVISFK